MTNQQIFDYIGLSAEQIRMVTKSVPRRSEPIVIETPAEKRPRCVICGQPVGKWSCRPKYS
jgi:hypothetical protein